VVWYVEVTLGKGLDNKPKKTRRSAKSRAEAVQLRRELNAQKIQGTLRQQVSTRFDEFALHWVRDVKSQRVRVTTAADYEFRVRKYLNPYFGSRNITALKPSDIHSWTSRLAKAGLGTNTINGARRILFGICKYAQRQGVLLDNPVAATDAIRSKYGEATQVRPAWTKDEALLVLNAAKIDPMMDLFLHLAIHTGLRHGELLGLTWTNLDLESKSVSISQTLREVRVFDDAGGTKLITQVNEPKTKASRRSLQLSKPLLDSIQRHLMLHSVRRVQAGLAWHESDYVFTSSIGTPINQANNLKAYKRFIKANGIRYIRVHDIRHTTAVLALEAGASLEWISQAFGHTGIEITKSVYAPYVQALNDKFAHAVDSYLTPSSES
jgi:integrase